ncbi:flavoprotein, partial [Acinetobacter nosocomialis]
KLQTWPIVKITNRSIHSMDGREQPVDIIIRAIP